MPDVKARRHCRGDDIKKAHAAIGVGVGGAHRRAGYAHHRMRLGLPRRRIGIGANIGLRQHVADGVIAEGLGRRNAAAHRRR